MSRSRFWLAIFVAVGLGAVILCPELGFAQSWGGGFEDKVGSLTKNLVNFLLPAVSVLGLLYAAILAATGDAGAKSRMVLVIIASMVGFLAPLFIKWLQSIAG